MALNNGKIRVMEKANGLAVEIGIETVKERSVKGIVALTTRTFFLQLVNFVGIFLLTIYLTPSAFGIFYVVSAIISFLPKVHTSISVFLYIFVFSGYLLLLYFCIFSYSVVTYRFFESAG